MIVSFLSKVILLSGANLGFLVMKVWYYRDETRVSSCAKYAVLLVKVS
jgi:hypothetical protein